MYKKHYLLILMMLLLPSCVSANSLDKISHTISGTYKDPSWSPDGKRIAVIYEKFGEDGELWVYDLGTKDWKFVGSQRSSFRNVVWINNDELVFVDDVDVVGIESFNWTTTVSFYNLNTSIETSHKFNGLVIDMDVSENNEKIAIVRDALSPDVQDVMYGITIFNSRNLTEEILYSPPLDENVDEVAWTPDGKYIAFTVTSANPLETNRVRVFTLNVMNVETGEIRTLIKDSQMTIESLSWSNDGKNIVARIIDNNYGSSLGLIAMDGSIGYADTQATNFVDIAQSPTEDILVLTSLGSPVTNALYFMYNPFVSTQE
jgi:Tol biopolymer transport system component